MTRYERIVKTLGKMPQKTNPDIAIEGKTDFGDYVIWDVTYFTEPNERVRAHVLIPKNASVKAPVPGIIALHQHNGEYYIGKAEPAGLVGDPMYFYGKELAERGFAVISPDHLGFEERKPSDIELKRRGISASQHERELFTHAICKGSTLQAKYLSDLVVAVDVLCSFDFVDSERIGTIGHSLGGQEALWLTFYDKRVKAGVSSCGFSTIRAVFNCHKPHNFAMYTFGLLEAGDIFALIEQMAEDGKAFMMINGTKDFGLPMDGVYALHECAAKAYSKAPDKYCAVIFEGGHSFPENIRFKAYEFLERALDDAFQAYS